MYIMILILPYKQTITNIPLTRSSGGFVTEKNTFPKKSHTALVRRSSSTDSLIVIKLPVWSGVGVANNYIPLLIVCVYVYEQKKQPPDSTNLRLSSNWKR